MIAKRIKTLAILLIIVLTFSACAPSVIRQTSAPGLPPVNPQGGAQAGRTEARLYFRVADEAFIGSELRQLDVGADETAEEAAFRGLISGPDTTLTQLAPLIPAGTELISIDISSGILFLTLSGEFLSPAATLPAGWQQDPMLVTQAIIEKRLALSAITNTFTELGSCESVLVQIEEGAAGAPDGMLALFGGDPLFYSAEYVLTPAKALRAALSALTEKNWSQLLRRVTSPEQLTESQIAAELSALGELVDYTLGEDTIAPGGETAVVTASVYLRSQDERITRSRENIPVRATRVQEVFRIEYDSLLRLLGAETDG